MLEASTSVTKTIPGEFKETKHLAKVAIDLPISITSSITDCFYYYIPEELRENIKCGVIVQIPFGKRETVGYVIDIVSETELHDGLSSFKIKPIHNVVYSNSLFDKKFLELATWISSYYLSSIGAVLAASIPSEILKKRRKQSAFSTQQSEIKGTEAQKHRSTEAQITLNNAQQNAYNTILKSITTNEPKTFLLHGITDSGKTEVYLRLIEEVLKNGKNVICLVPEIYLIPQIHERLKWRFNTSQIIIWHSSLTKSERLTNFEKIIGNAATIVLGARSAILTPINNLGLIVIDEAHENSYKQTSPAPRYDTINVALKRGKIENCPVILGTATPNIKDYYNFLSNDSILELPNRIHNLPMPEVCLIDLKEHHQKNKNIFSNKLKIAIEEALSKKEQIILLLNRRGYASQIFCMACGSPQYCKNCSVPLVFHKNSDLMICHHCGFKKGFGNNSICSTCTSPHLKYFGLGTQQLEEQVKKIFTEAKVIRADSDKLQKKDEYIKLWNEFANGQADILIGTQIVAKGLDLPNVTVVGVILADTMFNFPDYISYEKAFQLLTQVTGRTGRGQKGGRVYIQTYKTDNPIFQYITNHNYKDFYETEIKQRAEFLYPPFCTLSRIIFQSNNEEECINYANETLKVLVEADQHICPESIVGEYIDSSLLRNNATFLGPAPCFFNKLHGKYRYHILCKTKNKETHNLLFNDLFKRLKKNAKVDIIIDVDSVNLL